MNSKDNITIIGRSEPVDFPKLDIRGVAARIDTGAKTSAVWASNIQEKDGRLSFVLFDKDSQYFTGQKVHFKNFTQRVISSSNGTLETRYVVKFLVELSGHTIKASFSLANRSSQTYPVLVGRNILRGKFLVDVKRGQPLTRAERQHSQQLQSKLQPKEQI